MIFVFIDFSINRVANVLNELFTYPCNLEGKTAIDADYVSTEFYVILLKRLTGAMLIRILVKKVVVVVVVCISYPDVALPNISG